MRLVRRIRSARFSERHRLGLHVGQVVPIDGRDYVITQVAIEDVSGNELVTLESKDAWEARRAK